jgi:hypothetical protein
VKVEETRLPAGPARRTIADGVEYGVERTGLGAERGGVIVFVRPRAIGEVIPNAQTLFAVMTGCIEVFDMRGGILRLQINIVAF